MHRKNVTTACSNCVRSAIAVFGFLAVQFEEARWVSMRLKDVLETGDFGPVCQFGGYDWLVCWHYRMARRVAAEARARSERSR
jgi:hypothetical protein